MQSNLIFHVRFYPLIRRRVVAAIASAETDIHGTRKNSGEGGGGGILGPKLMYWVSGQDSTQEMEGKQATADDMV